MGMWCMRNLAARLKLTGVIQLWVADITYVRLRETFLYVAIVMDAYSRRVVGWELPEGPRAELALGALNRALASTKVSAFDRQTHIIWAAFSSSVIRPRRSAARAAGDSLDCDSAPFWWSFARSWRVESSSSCHFSIFVAVSNYIWLYAAKARLTRNDGQSHMIAEFRRFSGMPPKGLRRGRWRHPFIERSVRSFLQWQRTSREI